MASFGALSFGWSMGVTNNMETFIKTHINSTTDFSDSDISYKFATITSFMCVGVLIGSPNWIHRVSLKNMVGENH